MLKVVVTCDNLGRDLKVRNAMITLEPMQEAAYTAWQRQAVLDYAADKVEALTWTKAEAVDRARAEYAQLLPQGLATPHEYLWSITATTGVVGTLWVHHDPETAGFFIYDIIVNAEHRDHGYGQQALTALDDKARALGVKQIGLHVFGSNLRARHVYEKMGFVVTDISMTKMVPVSE